MKLKKGFLVAFEGIDGSGKTTQANLLYEKLKKKVECVILTKEPTDSLYGQRIRKLAQSGRESLDPHEEYLLFLNDRKIHVTNLIKPALEKNNIVISDRYYFSNIAYQGAIGLDPKKIKAENEAFAPIPEFVFLLEVPPKLGIRRIQRGRAEEPNLFEREEYLAKVDKVFKSLQDNYIYRIDGGGRRHNVHSKVMNAIEDILEHYIEQPEQCELFEGQPKFGKPA